MKSHLLTLVLNAASTQSGPHNYFVTLVLCGGRK